MLEFLKNGSGIHIKEKNKGSFTKWCGGNVTDECIRKGKNSPNPKIRKKATFAANARKWKHKEGGQLIKKAQGGVKLEKNVVIPFLYTIENPWKLGVYDDWMVNYDSNTIGPGVDKSSGVPSWWFENKKVPREDVENAAYNHLVHDDEVIRAAYDRRFGTEDYPNPSDTLSIGPRLYAAQNRYQMGNLGKGNVGRDAILDAMKSGNADKIKLAVKKYGRRGDDDRARRLEEAWPNMYEKKEEKKENKNFISSIVNKIMRRQYGGPIPEDVNTAYTQESSMYAPFIIYGQTGNDYLEWKQKQDELKLKQELEKQSEDFERWSNFIGQAANLGINYLNTKSTPTTSTSATPTYFGDVKLKAQPLQSSFNVDYSNLFKFNQLSVPKVNYKL